MTKLAKFIIDTIIRDIAPQFVRVKAALHSSTSITVRFYRKITETLRPRGVRLVHYTQSIDYTAVRARLLTRVRIFTAKAYTVIRLIAHTCRGTFAQATKLCLRLVQSTKLLLSKLSAICAKTITTITSSLLRHCMLLAIKGRQVVASTTTVVLSATAATSKNYKDHLSRQINKVFARHTSLAPHTDPDFVTPEPQSPPTTWGINNPRLAIFAIGALFFGITLAATASHKSSSKPQGSALGTTVAKPTAPPKPRTAEETIATMSLDEQISQLFIINIKGRVLDDRDIAFLKNFQPGGIILISENLQSMDSTLEFVRKAQASLKIPGFVAVDGEGGGVARMSWDTVTTNTKSHADAIASIEANLNLAPVLDSRVEGSFMQYRTIGATGPEIIKTAREIIVVDRASGIGSVVKHFPGLGSAKFDPHYTMGQVAPSMQDFLEYVAPYRNLKNDVTAVMTSHFKHGLLDQDTPITFSSKWISYLRSTIGYTGLVMTDDLAMSSVSNLNRKYSRSLLAGHDVLLTLSDFDELDGARQEIADAVRDGTIKESQIRASTLKILKAKEKLKIIKY